ncbi:CgeB family protein [Lysobacter soli]|uniref:CgeB family protein n=1 Tax=Lysobacter soli TaxID=453783 RepID=UPI0024100A10|nr:glycosyltransferase [Lysobacter soli]MDG2516437.1 glycosyltransferase [Lysobacter soli]
MTRNWSKRSDEDGSAAMIEAVKFWNEPNNKSHWDLELDPEWRLYAQLVRSAAQAVKAERPDVLRVLGGISPIDPAFMVRVQELEATADLDAVAVHGFPLDWNLWSIHDWGEKIAEIEAVTRLPVWVTEVGVSSFGAEEVQEFGLRRSAELLCGRVDRIHWYSLYDLPRAWEATTRHREFFDAARKAPEFDYLLGGSGWDDVDLPSNVTRLGHVPTRGHNAFNCSAHMVLNINRDSMARFGFSPPTRVFEAAGAGACLMTDAWDGIEMFLEPGREVLIADSAEQVNQHLRAIGPVLARQIGERARARMLREHTYAHRAVQLESLLEARLRAAA